ncbi:MAG: hypothetical protein H6R10_1683 [Rhodocyclaceae bacterium]|nr:hypothetical protein [Rhodocyclaceae bacterium]
MKFEHLIQINDPGNPLVESLTREQVWAGLMHRVENPLPFLPGLESFTILDREAAGIRRELNFGSALIHDQVTYEEDSWVRFDIPAAESHAGGSLTISIEEPTAGHLFLRFAYQTTLAEVAFSEDANYVEYVKSAYRESDVDTVRVIRTLAAGGRGH